MSTSRLLQTTQRFKQQLLQHESQAEATLNAAHSRTLAYIQPALDRLYKQIADKQKAGEQVPLSWLHEQNRLTTIKRLISGQINQYGTLAQTTTGQLQHVGVQLGLQSAQAQLQDTVPAGVSWSFGVPSHKAIENLIGATQKGSPLADLFSGFGDEAATNVTGILTRGVTLGQNPKAIAGDVQDALGISRARALTISRTEMLRSYRSANTETFRENSDVVGGWIWIADLDRRTCAACIAMNGTKHPLSEEFGSHPNCRCTPTPETKSWDSILGPLGISTDGIRDTTINIQSGSDWFDDQGETTQRAILGNAKYEAWKDGGFDLEDVVGHSHDPQWGNSVYEKSLRDLVKK